jgi:hypothetical protein
MEDTELSRFLRLSVEDSQRGMADLSEHVPGSKFDEIEFSSAGEGLEIRVANRLGFVPNRMEIVCAKDANRPYEHLEKLADKDFIYLKSNAPKGARFIARFYRME